MQKIAGLLIIAFILTATLMVFQPTAAQNNTLIVPDQFPTITQAIQNATHGDTIFVKTGIYNETIVIDKAITLKGEDTNRTIINGNCSGTVILIRYSSVTVTGLTIIYNSTQNSPRTYWVHNLPKDFISIFGSDWDSSYYPKDSGYFTRYGE
jgi:nitrous oxidase accessory protein